MISLSFAADFSFRQAIGHLFAVGTPKHSAQLKYQLLLRYGGADVRLFHNGRTALSEAIRYLVPQNSQVIVNGLTCYAVEQAVKAAACRPLFVDINDQDFNFDITKLTQVLKTENHVSAIIIQNHLGLGADIVAIEKLAKQHGLIIIEDLAHCAGSHYPDGREIGTVGSATALSFGKAKAIDTTEGGALIMRDPDLTLAHEPNTLPPFSTRLRDRIYPFLGWLIRKTYSIGLGKAIAAFAFKLKLITKSAEGKVEPQVRLTHWQAKLAYRQVVNLDRTSRKRRKYATKYGFPDTASILRIPVLVNHRDDLLQKLRRERIFLDDSWYEVPVAPRRYFHRSSFSPSACPVSVRVADAMLNLPLLPKTELKNALDIIKPEVITSDQ